MYWIKELLLYVKKCYFQGEVKMNSYTSSASDKINSSVPEVKHVSWCYVKCYILIKTKFSNFKKENFSISLHIIKKFLCFLR